MSQYRSSEFPRQLTSREQEFLFGILPVERKSYREYRDKIQSMVVLGQGRRGEGEIILGKEGDTPDIESPLSAVFAYGAIETNFGVISITARDIILEQTSVEIVSHKMDFVPEDFEEFRRWTYSLWKQGDACPQCSNPVREVIMDSEEGQRFVLSLCPVDKRLWVFDEEREFVRLIPVTNFYNELMLHKNIRDPKIAFDHQLLFRNLSGYSDKELSNAFFTYNKLRTKVEVHGSIHVQEKHGKGLFQTIKNLFSAE